VFKVIYHTIVRGSLSAIVDLTVTLILVCLINLCCYPAGWSVLRVVVSVEGGGGKCLFEC